VTYRYSLEDLLALLHPKAPAKVDALALRRRRVNHGLLSVGLKIHCRGDGRQFSELVRGLGGPQQVLDINIYRQAQATMCLVLPPVGSASAAILLLECIEQFTGARIFGNSQMQLQVCSPGRLTSRNAAMLGIAFYLGSDTLRRYRLDDLKTTFSHHYYHPRGTRLVIYDAEGDFEREFEWWGGPQGERVIERQLPIDNGRSDLLAGTASRLDIENVNLLATLLMHVEHDGYWKDLGEKFAHDMEALLNRHLLAGLVDAPWVRTTDPTSEDDEKFFAALQELVAYAFEEAVRIRERGRFWKQTWRDIPARSSDGILQEVQSMLRTYRAALIEQSQSFEKGDPK
jgi:hypothetical protein